MSARPKQKNDAVGAGLRNTVGGVVAALACGLLPAACGSGESPSRGLVQINEVSCHGRDWVEAVNVTKAPVDVGGWVVSDNPDQESHRYPLPSGTVLLAGEYLVVKQQEGAESGFPFGFACGEETAFLIDRDGARVDQVELGSPAESNAWGRLPDLTGLWRETSPTPGAPNEPPRVPAR